MAGEIDGALHDRINQKIHDHVVVDISACGIFKVPNPLREINKKAYEPQVISIGPYHRGKEHLKAMEVQKMNNLKFCLDQTRENSVEKYVTELKKMDKKIRGFYSENLDNIRGEELVEMMLLDGFFIIGLILHYRGVPTNFYWGNVVGDLLLVENQLPLSVLSKLYSLHVAQTRRLINDANDNVLPQVITFFHQSRLLPGLHIIARAGDQEMREPEPAITACGGNQDAKHILGLLHDNITRTRRGSPSSATAVSSPWWPPCLAWASRLQFPRWLPCLGPARRPPQLERLGQCSALVAAGTPKWRMIRSATELKEAGIKFQKKGGKFFDIEFQKEVMSIPTLMIDDYTESTFRNFVAYEQCYRDISSNPFTDYITFMDCLINTGKDVELLIRCGVLDNYLGDDEVVATMFNRLRDTVCTSEEDFFYSGIFNRVNEHCNRKRNLWKANLRHNYFNGPWALISFIAAVVLLLSTLLQTLFSILSYRH